jgi:hypothetical protein
MRRSISKLAIILILTAANSAPSKTQEKIVVDMGKLTCGELNKLGFQDFAGVTMWLSSYYNASINNTVVDLVEFAHAAKTVKEFCKTNTRATVVSAAESALGITIPR